MVVLPVLIAFGSHQIDLQFAFVQEQMYPLELRFNLKWPLQFRSEQGAILSSLPGMRIAKAQFSFAQEKQRKSSTLSSPSGGGGGLLRNHFIWVRNINCEH